MESGNLQAWKSSRVRRSSRTMPPSGDENGVAMPDCVSKPELISGLREEATAQKKERTRARALGASNSQASSYRYRSALQRFYRERQLGYKGLTKVGIGYSKPVAIPYFISHWAKVVFLEFGEVLAHVLIGQITAQENTLYRAIIVADLIESTSRFALFEKLIKSCGSKYHRYLFSYTRQSLPWRLNPEDGPQIKPSRDSFIDRRYDSVEPTSSTTSTALRHGNSTGERRA